MHMKPYTQTIALLLIFFCFTAGSCAAYGEGKGRNAMREPHSQTGIILVGPFDLHRRYRSMEGPYCVSKIRIANLLADGKLVIPEDQVTFVEGGSNAVSMSAAGSGAVAKTAGDKGNDKRELLWFKSIKLQVLDENDKPLPTAEFICHLNVDVDLPRRDTLFRQSDHAGNARIITLTQGQTEFFLPQGLAVPTASDETWTFTFQAANRTTDKHRRIKHLCTVEFIKNSDLKSAGSIKPLTWFNPYIAVAVSDANSQNPLTLHGPSCMVPTAGSNAPNMVAGSNVKDPEGRELAGHWAIPPGEHLYEAPITSQLNRGFGTRDRRIHAVWTHVHPLCSQSSLLLCHGDERETIFTAKARTRVKGGLQIERIEPVFSVPGIALPGGGKYILQSVYNNVTEETQDSMVAMGIFCADDSFVLPDWAKESATATKDDASATQQANGSLYCGIKDSADTCASKDKTEYAGTDRFPLFDESKDGPLLTAEKNLEITTNAGPIHIILNPKLAPKHATQLYKLMTNGAFTGTKIHRYEPGFVLQTSTADAKAPGQAPLPANVEAMLRRLPLEVESPLHGDTVLHKQWVLSMARYSPTDSAVTSFSILMGDAPHLDHEYTIFGRVVADATTLATIKTITDDWTKQHPYIQSIQPWNQ
jgi:cyclophilin family peptidyl-prolyl cis-trans isomerase